MRGLLREPLVHFLAGGAMLFLLYALVADPEVDRPDRIVVSEDRVVMLARTFERTWMRPPTEPELRGLIDDYVTEEVLYREALALGLDSDDLVIRRRLRQKMDYLNEGLAEREPSESELQEFLQADPERVRRPLRASFVQVFVNPQSDAAPEARAAELLGRLRAGERADALGDATLLPQSMTRATWASARDTFGTEFAEAVTVADQDVWSGPHVSAFGLHLVRLDALEPARIPELEEVRAEVEREWRADQRTAASERFHAALRERYDIEVRVPTNLRTEGVASR